MVFPLASDSAAQTDSTQFLSTIFSRSWSRWIWFSWCFPSRWFRWPSHFESATV